MKRPLFLPDEVRKIKKKRYSRGDVLRVLEKDEERSSHGRTPFVVNKLTRLTLTSIVKLALFPQVYR